MNLSRQEKKTLVKRDRFLKHKTLNGLFKILMNYCNLLMKDEHYDHCYCNLTYRQCWLCNFANYVRHNKVKDELLRNKQCQEHVIDISYRLLFYIKRIRNDGLVSEDREWVLDFFKRKSNQQ